MDWKQNVNEVTVRLRCGDGIQRKEDVNTSFTDKSCHVSFPGELNDTGALQADLASVFGTAILVSVLLMAFVFLAALLL